MAEIICGWKACHYNKDGDCVKSSIVLEFVDTDDFKMPTDEHEGGLMTCRAFRWRKGKEEGLKDGEL
jgi:hypothetical protein